MIRDYGELPHEESRGYSAATIRGLERPRYEIVPVKGAYEQAGHLPPGAEVSITCSPALGIEATIALAEELSTRGFRVVPHIPARLVTGEDHLMRLLERLRDWDLRYAFVIGGDVEEPAGPFASGLELLRAMSQLGHCIESIGIPAYPETHPFIEEEELSRALYDKQPFASYVVTQICFDPEVILRWLSRVRRQGIELPVYVGMPGVVKWRKLLRTSLKIGVGASTRYLSKNSGLAGRFVFPGGYSPDHLVEGLSPYVGDPDYGIRGFHINTFNHVEETERWRRRMLGSSESEG